MTLPRPRPGRSATHPPNRKPGRNERQVFLVEEEDEDDTGDEAMLGWAYAAALGMVMPDAPDGRLPGRVPVRVASRSAAPTQRLHEQAVGPSRWPRRGSRPPQIQARPARTRPRRSPTTSIDPSPRDAGLPRPRPTTGAPGPEDVRHRGVEVTG